MGVMVSRSAFLLLLFALVLSRLWCGGALASIGSRGVWPVLVAVASRLTASPAFPSVAASSATPHPRGRVLPTALVLRHHVQVLEDANAMDFPLDLQLHHSLGLCVSHGLPARGVGPLRALRASRGHALGKAPKASTFPAAATSSIPIVRPSPLNPGWAALPFSLGRALSWGRVVMVIVVQVIFNAAVALVNLAAAFHRALIWGLGCPQVVAKGLDIEIQSHRTNTAPGAEASVYIVKYTDRQTASYF